MAVLEKLTPEQIKKFRLADNKVAESKWDEVLLIEDLQELKATGYSVLDIPGFLEADIDKLLRGDQDNKGNKDPDHIPATNKDHEIKQGDLFALDEHRLLCGDSTSTSDVLRLQGGGQCNMCFTDPPYNVNYQGTRKAATYQEIGTASWYGNETLRQKDGHMTANGKAFDPDIIPGQ